MLPVRFRRGEFDDLFGPSLRTLTRVANDLFDREGACALPGSVPVDVRLEGDNWIVEAEVPGLKRDEVEITVENNVLTISGEYKREQKKDGAQYHVRERTEGRFSRSFTLPGTADGDKVKAELKDGLLTVTIPTREEAKPRRVEVK